MIHRFIVLRFLPFPRPIRRGIEFQIRRHDPVDVAVGIKRDEMRVAIFRSVPIKAVVITLEPDHFVRDNDHFRHRLFICNFFACRDHRPELPHAITDFARFIVVVRLDIDAEDIRTQNIADIVIPHACFGELKPDHTILKEHAHAIDERQLVIVKRERRHIVLIPRDIDRACLYAALCNRLINV